MRHDYLNVDEDDIFSVADLNDPALDTISDADGVSKPEEWTVITALDNVLEMAYHSEIEPALWDLLKEPLAFLREKLQLTNMQIVVLAMLVDAGKPLSWKNMSCFFDCSRLKMMTYTDEIEEMIRKRWVFRRTNPEYDSLSHAYALEPGVVEALRHNKPYIPPKIDGLTEPQFVEQLASYVKKVCNSSYSLFEDAEGWMMNFVAANMHLPLCKFVSDMDCDIHNKTLMLLFVADYCLYADRDNEGLTLQSIDETFPEDIDCQYMRNQLLCGIHPLFEAGMIENKCEDGIADPHMYVLTSKAKAELLSEIKPHCIDQPQSSDSKWLKGHNTITEKPLYFNATEEEQLHRLVTLLQPDEFGKVQQRLQDSGMRRGFACLFYGGPGTGKTESVLQIARRTGRDIMQVDIAGMRDKWVGESEKNIKQIFTKYRELCKNRDLAPILFFNEADALINKRNEHAEQAVDKMDNAMQNILLQEMENLDGILIATTNLTSNFDAAFERRFLFKIEFRKPDVSVKAKIWSSMISSLSPEDALCLANRYDFSGGQIENIARKNTIEYIISGNNPTLLQLDSFCREESISDKNRRPVIGFNRN